MIVPRKDEREAVSALLEDDSFESADKLSAAIIKTVAGLLAQRDKAWFVTLDGAPIGPFWAETDAARWIRRTEQEHGLKGHILPLWPETVYDLTDDQNTNTACECGHARSVHVVTGAGSKQSKPKDCGVIDRHRVKCPCSTYQPRKRG